MQTLQTDCSLQELDKDVSIGIEAREMRREGGGVILEDVFVEEDCVAFGTADSDGGGDAFNTGREGQGVHVFSDLEEP